MITSPDFQGRPLPADGAAITIAVPPVPMPMPRPDGGVVTPHVGPVRFVAGTAGNDTLVLQPGGFAFGGGGDDTFVLVSGGRGTGVERLGVISDFNAGDKLDLSQLGANAKVLARETGNAPGAPDRMSIDYDGDGKEDGFLLVGPGRPFGEARPLPMPIGEGPRIQPLPGEVHILPFPGPGDAPWTRLQTLQAFDAPIRIEPPSDGFDGSAFLW